MAKTIADLIVNVFLGALSIGILMEIMILVVIIYAKFYDFIKDL